MSGKNPARVYAKEFVGGGGLTTVQAASVAAAIVAATPAADATGTVYGDVAGGLLGPLVVQALHGDEAAVTLGGDVDDYDLGDGLRDAFYWLIDFGGFDVSGFVAPGTPGELHCIVNTGTAGNLLASSGGSAAENQIVSASGDAALATDAAILIAYSGTLERWIAIGATGSGSGVARPPFDYIVAASNASAEIKAIADVVSDGTADEDDLSAAIVAAVASGRPYTIRWLGGTFDATAGPIDFTPLVARAGIPLTIDFTGATIRVGGNITTLLDMAAGAGGQLLACLTLRGGKLDGNKTNFTCSRAIDLLRASDLRIEFDDTSDFSGDGMHCDTSSVTDYPTANNFIRFYGRLANNGGAMLRVIGGTNAFGFTGNIFGWSHGIANGDGILLGSAVNQNAIYNIFDGQIIEHTVAAGGSTGTAISDKCGGNLHRVANLNSNVKELGGVAGTTLRSTFEVGIDTGSSGTIDAAVLDQHRVTINGVSYGRQFMAEKASTPSNPPTGFGDIYFKTDGHIYSLNPAGTETRLDNTGLPPSGTAGGDLSGTYPNPTVAKVNGVAVTGTAASGRLIRATGSAAAAWADENLDDLADVTITIPASADRLRYNGAAWVNSALIWAPVMVLDPGTGNYLVLTDTSGNPIMAEV